MGRRALITGGAGYIGSHCARALAREGWAVTVLDRLSTGHREAVPGIPLVVGDVADAPLVRGLLANGAFDVVLHFAAMSLVGESASQPETYWRNNVGGTLSLVEAMGALSRAGPPALVFSSSAAVYGDTGEEFIAEHAPLNPTSPYGDTKLAAERLIRAAGAARGFHCACLRYFNAAGAEEGGAHGEDHHPESHLIPRVLAAARDGTEVEVFGDDYPTPDGACVRDYVHVDDLAAAHRLAAERLLEGETSLTLNLGAGVGASVWEVLAAVESVTGRRVRRRVAPRRPGDPARLVARSDAAREALGWTPRHADLLSIVASAWEWHRARPRGYASP
ncbi:MAG: UDP-glucose 4-epimerase GalE [Planctomycetes bacterium]|nr:UDP-glucose 4-epimerase GalE [Planctomycetota bacterium]